MISAKHGNVDPLDRPRQPLLNKNGAVVYGKVEDHSDGTCTVTLIPQTAGPHQLLITMDGQHVQNSPHDLEVVSKRDYRTLHEVQPVMYRKSR